MGLLLFVAFELGALQDLEEIEKEGLVHLVAGLCHQEAHQVAAFSSLIKTV